MSLRSLARDAATRTDGSAKRQEVNDNATSLIDAVPANNSEQQRPGTSFLKKMSQKAKPHPTANPIPSDATPRSNPRTQILQEMPRKITGRGGVRTERSDSRHKPNHQATTGQDVQVPHPAAAEVLKSQLAALDGNAHLTPCLAASEGVAQGNPGAGTVLMFATLPPTAQDPPSSRANSAQLDNSTVLTDAVGNTTTGGRGSYAQLVRDRELHRQPIQKQIRQGDNVSQAGKRGSRGATIDDLHMTAGLASAFRSLGILTAPTPVQIRAISACRACSDFICDMRSSEQRIQVIAALLAETAWAAPLGETVAIMLTPSKVVAKQTVKILDDALALGLSSTTAGGVQGAAVAQLVGSKGMTGQATALRSARVAVGTFQRAAMFVTSGALRAEHLRLVILDDPSILEHESNAPLVNAVETVKNWLPAKRKIVAFGEAFSQRAVDRLRVWMGPFQRVDLQEGGRDGPERGTKRSGVHGQRNPQKRRRGGGGA